LDCTYLDLRPQTLLDWWQKARPDVFGPLSPHRIQLDVSIAGEQIAVRLDQRRPESTLEQTAGARVASIHVLHVPLPDLLHNPRHAIVFRRRHQQVDVVGHQHIGMHRHPRLLRRLCQVRQEETPIRVLEEHRSSIGSSKEDMHR
jgi:hypothetical protein